VQKHKSETFTKYLAVNIADLDHLLILPQMII